MIPEVSHLSSHDLAVLGTITDGNKLDASSKIDQNLQFSVEMGRGESEIEDLVSRELKSVRFAEKQCYHEALVLLDDMIIKCPWYAPAYNNRAQVIRISEVRPISSAIEDLNKAISISEPRGRARSVSQRTASVLRCAYNQLAAIYYNMGQLCPTDSESAWNYQARASELLGKAGGYGDEAAAQVFCEINPYAKLCGSIVNNASNAEKTQPIQVSAERM